MLSNKSYTLAFIDIGLPDTNGQEIAKFLRNENHKSKRIA